VIAKVLLDTGPLIALFDRHDRHHAWVAAQFDQILPPLLTCDAVLTEACYLARRAGRPAEEPLLLLERGVLRLAFDLSDDFGQVSSLMKRYASVPMALADACLVRMSELFSDSVLLTLDSDFRIYRRHKRQRIPVLLPAEA
jgi:predicted nucleic acid-binding protein